MAAICNECAENAGGKWTEGHLATCWVGECAVCGEDKSCCDNRDWCLNFNWKTKQAWPMNRKPTMMEVD